MKRALASLLTLALAACSVTVTVRLPDQEFKNFTAPNTAGKIIYPKNPSTFDPPPVQAKRVEITGEANLSPHTPLSLVVYARTSEPSSECSALSDIYICDEGQKDTDVGQIDFTKAPRTSFTLGQRGGETLAQGVNQGWLWLGVKVEGTGSLNSTLTLKEMEATVTVQF